MSLDRGIAEVSAYLAGVSLVLAISAFVYWIMSDASSKPRIWWTQYINRLNLLFKSMHKRRDAERIGQLQLGASMGIALYALYTEAFYLGLLVVAIILVPWIVLKQLHQRRLDAIDDQIEGWLLSLANGLKAAPSIGDAIEASLNMVQAPLREELDVCVKEMRLGTPVDQAITNLTRRLQSSLTTAATTAILIGRQTGGELSAILERTAASLREMRRLEGVVRARTAEGRNQANVLRAMPFVLLGIIHSFDPTWFEPLLESTLGYLVVLISVLTWMVGIVWARKIMSVDI